MKSIGQISRTQRVLDNDADYGEPLDMLAERADDNQTLIAHLRETHNVCDEHRDMATASLIEVWIDEAERRAWFLFETTRRRNRSPTQNWSGVGANRRRQKDIKCMARTPSTVGEFVGF